MGKLILTSVITEVHPEHETSPFIEDIIECVNKAPSKTYTIGYNKELNRTTLEIYDNNG